MEATVRELREENRKTNFYNHDRITEIEHEILNVWLARKKGAYWEIGRLLCEARPMYAYKEGFMKWVDKKFGREFKHRRAYDYMRLYMVCQPKELIYLFPMRLLQKICMVTFNEELRGWIFDHREDFNTGIPDDLFDRIVEKVTADGFDPEDPELQGLLKRGGEKKDELHYLGRVRDELEYKQQKYNVYRSAENEWMAAAKAKLPDDEKDKKVKLTKELESMPIVRILKELKLMPDYELVD